MKLAYFDCFSGAAGDMIVGAMLDAGLPLEALRERLSGLKLPGYALSAERVLRAGLAGTKFHVHVEPPAASAVEPGGHPHRRLPDILAMIDGAHLPDRPAGLAKAIFQRLASAEAKVHGIAPDQVHFHEVGAVDSIVDVVGSAIGLDLLGIDAVHCSPIPVGDGTIVTEHGVLPVPAPATAELLKGAALAEPMPSDHPAGELTTPTGAAILTTLAAGYGPTPGMTLDAVGYGAGTRDRAGVPNLLRLAIGRADADASVDAVVELSANLDDCTGQVLASAMEKLLAAACLDAWCAPIYMKKSRPAWMLSALCLPRDVERVERIFFAETTTLGVRRRTCSRSKLLRRHETVSTPYGPIRVKVGSLPGGQDATAAPEYADCAAAAEAHGAALREVMAAAMQAFRQGRK